MKDLQLYSVDDMTTMATAIAQSGLFGMKTPDQALALMLVAQAEGQHPATITQDYDIIQGRACRKSHSLLARFQQMGGSVKWVKLNDETAEGVFTHPAGGSLRVTWTIEQAKKAGLAGKDNWKKYPQAMLRARAISEGVRALYPAAIGGMLIAEEAQDMPRGEINMGNAVVEPASTADKVKAALGVTSEDVIDTDTGEVLTGPDYDDMVSALANCHTPELLDELKDQARDLYPTLEQGKKANLTKWIKAAEEELESADS